MKILQLYHKVPFPAHDGGAYSIRSASISIMRQGIDLRILAMDPSRSPCNTACIPEDFRARTNFECIAADNRIRPLQAARAVLSGSSYLSRRFMSANFRTRLIEILKIEKFDIVQLEHLYLCHFIDDIRRYSGARIVLRAQNVEHIVWKSYCGGPSNLLASAYLNLEAAKLEKFERRMSCEVDAIIALTAQDADWFRNTGSKARITAIPVGIDLSEMNGYPHPAVADGIPAFYHLGSMDWRPNIQGMKWFVKEILPEATKLDPRITVSIAGKQMPQWFFRRSGPHLSVTGEVADDVGFEQNKEVMIVPVCAGSGIRVKILRAMALGKAIMSTPLGAQGIEAVNNESIFIAGNPEEFALQMVKLAGNPSLVADVGRKARTVIESHYELDHVGRMMNAFYRELL